MKLSKTILCGVSLLAVASPARAQAEPDAATTEAQSTDQDASTGAEQNYGEIVVTAQRREERAHDVPITIVVATGDELDRAGVTTVRDLGKVVSGLTLSGQGFQNYPGIRGVSTFVSDGIGSGPIAVYMDGVYQPLNTAMSVEMTDIDRVEVLKGPQGTLFGRNAVGGAIQLFSKRPSFEPQMDIKMAFGWFTGDGGSRSSLNSRVSAFVSGPIVADTVAVSLSAGYRYTPGYLTNDVSGKRDGEIQKAYGRAKLLITPSDSLEFLAEAHYLGFENFGEAAQAPYRGRTAAAVYPGSIIPTVPWHVAYDSRGDTFYDQWGGSFTAKFDLAAGTLSSITAYDKSHMDVFNSIHGARAAITCEIFFVCLDTEFDVTTKTFQQELNFASRDFGPFSFTAGLFYLKLRSDTDFFGQPLLFPPRGLQFLDLTVNNKSYAAYGEVTFKATDRLTLIGGLRYSKEKYNDSPLPTLPNVRFTEDAFTPRVSIKYEISDAVNVYATYSHGYKAGLSGATNTGSVPPFQPVAAEKIIAYEVGAKFSSRNASFNIAAFYYDYKQKQESITNGMSAVLQNTGPVRIYGVDADASFRLTDQFSFRGNASWLPEAEFRDFPNAEGHSNVRGPTGAYLPGIGLFAQSCPPDAPPGCVATGSASFDATGLRLYRAPKFSGSGTLIFQTETSDGKFDASATLSYSSKIFHTTNQAVGQPGVALLSAQLGYEFGDSGLRVGIYGYNLTNQDVIQASLSSPSGHLQTLIAPRELGVKIDFSF